MASKRYHAALSMHPAACDPCNRLPSTAMRPVDNNEVDGFLNEYPPATNTGWWELEPLPVPRRLSKSWHQPLRLQTTRQGASLFLLSFIPRYHLYRKFLCGHTDVKHSQSVSHYWSRHLHRTKCKVFAASTALPIKSSP
jgi:hypothetical protein